MFLYTLFLYKKTCIQIYVYSSFNICAEQGLSFLQHPAPLSLTKKEKKNNFRGGSYEGWRNKKDENVKQKNVRNEKLKDKKKDQENIEKVDKETNIWEWEKALFGVRYILWLHVFDRKWGNFVSLYEQCSLSGKSETEF